MDGSEGIQLIPVGEVKREVLQRLREPLRERFGRPVEVDGVMELRRDWYAPKRGQYRADRILDTLVGEDPGDGGWRLAVVDADLYAPGLNFIFGQATVSGCCAVIGLARLRPEFYGREADGERFFRRVLTEAVHELGHVAGRGHCDNPECVMYFSNTIEETDRKGTRFCPVCGAAVAGVEGEARAADD